MQLGAGVVGAGEAAAAEAGGLQVEVATVFLDQHVGRHLGGAEEAVERVVDRHVLADAVPVGVVGVDLPPVAGVDQRQPVRGVAVDLVGAGEDEHRIGAVVPRGLQQVQGAVGVDREVGVGIGGGPVVRRLSRGVHDEFDVGPVLREQVVDEVGVADVAVDVNVAVAQVGLELALLPAGRGLGAEELLAHVVVDADDGHAGTGEVAAGLRSDETGRSGHDGGAHGRDSLLVVAWRMIVAPRSLSIRRHVAPGEESARRIGAVLRRTLRTMIRSPVFGPALGQPTDKYRCFG